MKQLLTISILVGMMCPVLGYAQAPDGKARKKQLREAHTLFQYGNYPEAAKLYSQMALDSTSTVQQRYEFGASLFHTNQDAEQALSWLASIPTDYKHASYYRAQCLHRTGQIKAARTAMNQYIEADKLDPMIDEATLAHWQNMLNKAEEYLGNPTPAAIESLGDSVNSPFDDYAPLVTAQLDQLVFTTRRPEHPEASLGLDGRYKEHIVSSNRQDQDWVQPELLDSILTSKYNMSAVSITPDGMRLVLFMANEDGSDGDLYESELMENWSNPIPFPATVNSEFREFGATISPDGQFMIFSSDRPDGFGGRDLYQVRRLPDGTWSKASSLGPKVNSPHDDDAPFLHPNGKVLYFSSKGHHSMGGYDIMFSTQDSLGNWLSPRNMRSPVNTVNDDLFFVTSPDGMIGYFSSKRPDGLGGQDLYSVALPSNQQAIQIIKGKVTSSSLPIGAKISVFDINNGKLIGLYKSNKKSGKFLLALPQAASYEITVTAPGQHAVSEVVQCTLSGGYEERTWNIELKRDE